MSQKVLATPVRSLRRSAADFLHRARVTRDRAIIDGIARVAPAEIGEFLDIGCSDGRIAEAVGQRLSIEPNGVDVELQADVRIPAQQYDGFNLPFGDGRFGLVTIVDVLHHADSPEVVLRDALRVLRPGGLVVIKDHIRRGRWGNWVLGKMDTTSNFGTHEIIAGTYLSLKEWETLVAGSGGEIVSFETPFRVHGLPWRLVARDSYHVLMTVVPAR